MSVPEETGLSLALSETPKTGFVPTGPICSQSANFEFTLIRAYLQPELYMGDILVCQV